MFLAQLGLDKPFTGGLGSYKLYVMLGAIIDSTARTVSKYNNQGGPPSTSTSTSTSTSGGGRSPSGTIPGAVKGVTLGADFVLQVCIYMYI